METIETQVVRRYYRDPRCLTDIVRGCILVSSIRDVWIALEIILRQSDVAVEISKCIHAPTESGMHPSAGDLTDSTWTSRIRGILSKAFGSSKVDVDEERELLVGGEEEGCNCIFKLCKIKDRFTDSKQIGYRDLCLGLEVGWDIKSEGGSLEFVHVEDFEKKHVRTHICEVQIMLKSMYDLKANGAHDNFVQARNLLCE
jgi:hypothetical protein